MFANLIGLHLFWQSAKCRLQSHKFAGYLQTNLTIEISCSRGVAEDQNKHHKIANREFSSKQVQPLNSQILHSKTAITI